jgi:periplasmic divalent cation tolerance protein
MTDYIIVTTTTDNEDTAKELAELIVEEKLAACVQITPVHSVYRWKGAVESEPEFLLSAKTKRELADSLMDFIQQNHTYEVPEIVVVPILAGSFPYLSWIDKEVNAVKSDDPSCRAAASDLS